MDSIRSQLDCGRGLSWEILDAARSPATMDRYVQEAEHWQRWLAGRGLSRSPLSLIMYLHHLHGSPRVPYALQILAVIRHSLALVGEVHLYTDLRLKLSAEGVVRLAPKQPKPPRPPLRWFMLIWFLKHGTRDRLFLRDACIMLVSLFGLLRASETAELQRHAFVPHAEGELAFSFFRKKKPPCHPASTHILPNSDRFGCNPASLVSSYLSCLPDGDPLLFRSSTGLPLTSAAISSMLKRRFASSPWSFLSLTSHSLRIGGAVFAVECGKTETEVKALGRWSSDTILVYMRDISRIF